MKCGHIAFFLNNITTNAQHSYFNSLELCYSMYLIEAECISIYAGVHKHIFYPIHVHNHITID